MHDVGFVVGDGIDAFVAGGLRDVHFHAHRLEELTYQVLVPVPIHLEQVWTGINPCKCIDRFCETVSSLLELDDWLDRFDVVRMRRHDCLEVH